jgi:valyl-tRNA synthetase
MSSKKTTKAKSKSKPKISLRKWNPLIRELEILKDWEDNGVYEKYKLNKESKKPIFSIDTPPPYPSGRWHIGAVAQYTMIDMIARVQRLRGYNVLFPWGLDRNGINIEFTVERKYKKSLHEFDRQEFIELCEKEITVISDQIDTIAKRIGCSMDFEGHYKTDSKEYRAVTQRSFIELFNKGYIFEDLRPNNYDASLGTTIADAEIYYKEGETSLNYIKFPLENAEDWQSDDGHIMIATTRPELICACQIILVHPEDERFKHLHGKKALLPIYNRPVEIRAHPAASMEYGSGAVMICSYGDSTDVQLFRELRLEPIQAIDLEGKLTEAGGPYQGLDVNKAQEKIIFDLDMKGYLENSLKVGHKYPVCERSGNRIEIILLKEYYVKQVDFLDDLRKMADEMKFHPKKNKTILLDWINGVSIDWPISRRRYYHTEIPVWKCKSCDEIHLPEPGKYYKPWCEDPPFKDQPCKKCGSKEGYIGEEKTFDTWMDSSNSGNYIIKYGQDEKFFKENHPCSLRPQGREIVRTWLYYTMLKNRLLFNKNAFEHVWISGLGMDKHGKKMSKSLGNVIDPDEIINDVGVDAFRFWAATVSHVGDDFRIDREKISNTKKILTKIFNIAKFVSIFPNNSEEIKNIKLRDIDKWILGEMNKFIEESVEGYDDFDFIIPAQAARNFAVNKFASHYLEMVKSRAYEKDEAATATLHTCLKSILIILNPIIPFLTYKLYNMLYGEDIQFIDFPLKSAQSEDKLCDLTESLIEFNSLVWKTKHDKKISLKDPISMEIPDELSLFKEDLIEMHHLE